jgi:DNA-binding XRE family transcriptional regulator
MAQILDNNLENYIYDYRIKVAEALKEMRVKKAYSQEELAEAMKVNRSTISKIENGKFNLSVDYLSKFSWFLGFELQLKENKNNKTVTKI